MKHDYRKSKEGKRRFDYPRIYALTFAWQKVLYRLGIAWHNKFSDECTADFNCCESIGRKAWLKLPKRKAAQ